jgi:hypothetical protein
MMGTHVKHIISADFQLNLLSGDRIIFLFQQLTLHRTITVIFPNINLNYKMHPIKVPKCFQLHSNLKSKIPFPIYKVSVISPTSFCFNPFLDHSVPAHPKTFGASS